MKISVSAEQIAQAKQRDSQSCMVADAIRDEWNATYVSVDIQSIKFSRHDKDTRYVFLTPPEVQKAIIAFDQGKAIKPFTFSLTSPVSQEPMQHWSTATKESQRKSSAKYMKTKRAGKLPPKQKRHHAPREREFGVRLLSA